MAKYNWRLHVEKDSSSDIETADIYSNIEDLEDGQPYLSVDVPANAGGVFDQATSLKGYVQGTTYKYDNLALSAYVVPDGESEPFRLKQRSGKEFANAKLLYTKPGKYRLTLPDNITRFVAYGVGAGSLVDTKSLKTLNYNTIHNAIQPTTPLTTVSYAGERMEVPMYQKVNNIGSGITGYKYNANGYFDKVDTLEKNSIEYYGTPSGRWSVPDKKYLHGPSADSRVKIFSVGENKTVDITVAGNEMDKNAMRGLEESIDITLPEAIYTYYPQRLAYARPNDTNVLMNTDTIYDSNIQKIPTKIEVTTISTGGFGSKADFATGSQDVENYEFIGSVRPEYLNEIFKLPLVYDVASQYDYTTLNLTQVNSSIYFVKDSDSEECGRIDFGSRNLPFTTIDSLEVEERLEPKPNQPFKGYPGAPTGTDANGKLLNVDNLPSYVKTIINTYGVGKGVNGLAVMQPFFSYNIEDTPPGKAGQITSPVLMGGKGGNIASKGEDGKVSRYAYIDPDYNIKYYRSGSGGGGGSVNITLWDINNPDELSDRMMISMRTDTTIHGSRIKDFTNLKYPEAHVGNAIVLRMGGELDQSTTKIIHPNTGAVAIVYGQDIESGVIPVFTWAIPHRSASVPYTDAPVYKYRELHGNLPFALKTFTISPDLIVNEGVEYSRADMARWDKNISNRVVIQYKNQEGQWTEYTEIVTREIKDINIITYLLPLSNYSDQWRIVLRGQDGKTLQDGVTIDSYSIYDDNDDD